VATPSPARSLEADYTAWGHSSVVKYVELFTILRVPTSVVDPDSDPLDTYVFGPSGSFHQQAIKVRNALISSIL
jgi:hypothetical protein